MTHRTPNEATWRSDKVSHDHVADYKPFQFVDGEGVRCSLYVSGCLFACDGCFNEAAWSFKYGEAFTGELEDRILADLAHPGVQGLSLLGGEPFLNTAVCLRVVRRMRDELPNKDVWAWSGYRFEQLMMDGADKRELIELVDVLVDGPFDTTKRDLTLAFKGSTNQRVVDARASRLEGRAVPWERALASVS